MALSEEKIRGYVKRLLSSRMRILINHGFYGLLLMHVIFSVDDSTETAYTDGERIAFSPNYLDTLSDSELDFILLHEILHIVLQHTQRDEDKQLQRYDTASDIVVNSIILEENGVNTQSITLSQSGEAMHTAPNGQEGKLYTAEEVYEMLPPLPLSVNCGGGQPSTSDGQQSADGEQKSKKCNKQSSKKGDGQQKGGTCDDHSHWGQSKTDEKILRNNWKKHLKDANEAMQNRSCGNVPEFAKRLLDELMKPQIDWRSILNDFIQEEICDYSFSPPDRRFQDSPFFLPDFNEKEDIVKDILFMIDASHSISKKGNHRCVFRGQGCYRPIQRKAARVVRLF